MLEANTTDGPSHLWKGGNKKKNNYRSGWLRKEMEDWTRGRTQKNKKFCVCVWYQTEKRRRGVNGGGERNRAAGFATGGGWGAVVGGGVAPATGIWGAAECPKELRREWNECHRRIGSGIAPEWRAGRLLVVSATVDPADTTTTSAASIDDPLVVDRLDRVYFCITATGHQSTKLFTGSVTDADQHATERSRQDGLCLRAASVVCAPTHTPNHHRRHASIFFTPFLPLSLSLFFLSLSIASVAKKKESRVRSLRRVPLAWAITMRSLLVSAYCVPPFIPPVFYFLLLSIKVTDLLLLLPSSSLLCHNSDGIRINTLGLWNQCHLTANRYDAQIRLATPTHLCHYQLEKEKRHTAHLLWRMNPRRRDKSQELCRPHSRSICNVTSWTLWHSSGGPNNSTTRIRCRRLWR